MRTVLVYKLIEELIRFPLKRTELLEKKVSEYVVLQEAFRSGDQYIVPEYLSTWDELLRMDWLEDKTEKPKYVEEMMFVASAPAPAPAGAAAGVAEGQQAMPPILQGFLGEKHAKAFKWIPQESLLTALEEMGVPLDELEELGQVIEAPILLSRQYVLFVARQLKLSIIQLVYEEDNPVTPEPIVVRATADKVKMPALVMVQLPDNSVGFLSAGETITPIESDKMPKSLRDIFLKTPPIFI